MRRSSEARMGVCEVSGVCFSRCTGARTRTHVLSSCCELARREGMIPPKQTKTPIAGAKHEWAANVRAGVRSAATSKEPRHENAVQSPPRQVAVAHLRPGRRWLPPCDEDQPLARQQVLASSRARQCADLLRSEWGFARFRGFVSAAARALAHGHTYFLPAANSRVG